MRRFNSDDDGARAAQVWLILVGYAMNRQTIRYRSLEYLMYGHATSGIASRHALGRIQRYCREHGLPELNNLVCGSNGTPGQGVPPISSGRTLLAEREAIYAEDWYSIVPPTAAELPAWFPLSDAAE